MESNQTGPTVLASTGVATPASAGAASPINVVPIEGASSDAISSDTALILEELLPYRLSLLANHVSQGLARLYADRYDLSVAEWRVMAAVGRVAGANANRVCDITAMDKVRVSRAVARLMKQGRLVRESDRADRRRAKLYLSEAGRTVHDEIMPMARAYEAEILSALDDGERMLLDSLLERIADSVPVLQPGARVSGDSLG